MRPKDFLSKAQLAELSSCIQDAEHQTSGEIRIHIDRKCTRDAREQAIKTFHLLGTRKTAARNGVLIYVACDSHKFAIIGDKGINEVVPPNFWKDVCLMLETEFKRGAFAEGLEEAVRMTGEKLKAFFPYLSDDKDELPNEVSIGKDEESDEK